LIISALIPNKLFPSLISCFPAVIVVPETRVSSSEKPGALGTLILSSWNGKFSLDGNPPPNEIMPGLDRYLAAPFREDGFRAFASVEI
jgi:hypothetical protein